MNPNKEHIEEGQTELSAETTTNINRVKAALTTEPVDPETAAAFEQAVTQKPAFKAAADLKSEKKKSNPFNAQNLRFNPAELLSAVAKKLLTTVPVGKPNKQDFIRVHPGEEYREPVALLDFEGDTYLVVPSVAVELGETEYYPAILHLMINRQKIPSLWVVKLPKADGTSNGRTKKWYGSAAIDFEQQEFAIAAALSGDPRMWQAYETGDPYLAFAKQARIVSAGATKDTHPEESEVSKRCILGIQYAMAEQALARKIEKPVCEARELLRLHKDVYSKFWEWSDNSVDHAVLTGRQSTVFGWINHVTADYNPRSLRNFHMQANGAEMLRLSCCLGTENGISVCAPVHDALMITAPLDRLEEDVIKMQSYMEEASRVVLSDKYPLRTEAKTYKFPDRYFDKRGNDFWNRVMSLLPKD